MSNEHCDEVMAAIFKQPWAILPEALEQIIAIASRATSDVAAAEAVRASRQEHKNLLEATVPEKIAVIPIHGSIIPRADFFADMSGAVSVARINAMLDAAIADDEVSAILLDIDSPGGQVTGINDLACRIREAGKTKPVTAYVSGMAASAAYWLASAADWIVADMTSNTGSIGVVYAWTDESEARKAQGKKDYVIVSSQSPYKYLDPKSKEGAREIQEHADALAEIFIGQVAKNRGVSAKKVQEKFGQGRVMLSKQALAAGMIDEIGVMSAALARAAGQRETENSNERGSYMGMTVLAKNRAEGDDKHPDDEEDKEAKTRGAKANGNDNDEDKPGEEDAEADDPAEEDEEDEEDKAQRRQAQKKAKAENSRVYQIAYRAGVEAERGRLKAIHGLQLVGHAKLVESAMFKNPMSAANLALAALQADKKLLAAAGAARLAESKDVAVNATHVDSGTHSADAAEKQDVLAYMSGQKTF